MSAATAVIKGLIVCLECGGSGNFGELAIFTLSLGFWSFLDLRNISAYKVPFSLVLILHINATHAMIPLDHSYYDQRVAMMRL